MTHLMADKFVVAAYFFAMFGISYFSSRKISSIRDYALSEGRYSDWSLALSLFMTYMSSGLLVWIACADLKEVVCYAVCVMIVFLAESKFVVRHIDKFDGALCVSDVMRALYGRVGQYTTVVITAALSLLKIALYIFYIAVVFNMFFEVGFYTSLIIISVVLCVYPLRGGMETIVMTDIFQFWIAMICVPLAVLAICINNNISLVDSAIVNGDGEEFLIKNSWLFVFSALVPNGYHFQVGKMLMCENPQSAARVFKLAGIFIGTFILILGILMFLIRSSSGVDVIDSIKNVRNMLPIGMSGFLFVGFLGFSFTTIDAWLNTISVMITTTIKSTFNIRVEAVTFCKIVPICFLFLCCSIALMLNVKEVFRFVDSFGVRSFIIPYLFFGMMGYVVKQWVFVCGLVTSTLCCFFCAEDTFFGSVIVFFINCIFIFFPIWSKRNAVSKVG